MRKLYSVGYGTFDGALANGQALEQFDRHNDLQLELLAPYLVRLNFFLAFTSYGLDSFLVLNFFFQKTYILNFFFYKFGMIIA